MKYIELYVVCIVAKIVGYNRFLIGDCSVFVMPPCVDVADCLVCCG